MADRRLQLAELTRVLRAADLLTELRGQGDLSLSGIAQDSRAVRRGDVFLAWRGVAADGHDFAASAVESGAVALVVERPLDIDVTQLVVSDGRMAAAVAADVFFGSPWEALFTTAITGTNGKTTTASLGRWILAAQGPAASVGTMGLVGPDGLVRPGTEGLTTPGPVEVSRMLADLAGEGIRSVTFEASSHALDQRRLDGVRFDTVVFTNLSQDHLDYHGTMADYASAKARLTELRTEGGRIVLNADDPAWRGIVRDEDTLTYGSVAEARLRSLDVQPHGLGTRFTLALDDQRCAVDLPLLGDFNVENALAAAGIGVAAGLGIDAIGERLSTAPQIKGRLEVVASEPFRVLIDFAHTPDALDRVLATLRPLVEGRLIVLFGAGGDRDPKKRPLMGAAVARGADLAIVTSDNPRTEDPDTIIDGIVEGMAGVEFRREADRSAAIRLAVQEARAGDLVLLAGKGHEAYQVIGTEKRPFDEARIAREAIEAAGGAA